MMSALAFGGCAQPSATNPPPIASQPIESVVTNLSTPIETARTALRLMQNELRAVAQDKPKVAEDALEQLQQVVDVAQIAARFNRLPGSNAAASEETTRRRVRDATQSWSAIIAYYAAGLELDRPDEPPVLPNFETHQVVFRAQRDGHAALIRLECHRGKDDKWRVVSVDFVAHGAAATASQPVATRPTP